MSAGEFGTTVNGVTGRRCETRLGAAVSADTYNALEDAIRAHVADESEGIVTDWYLVVAAESMTESRTNYLHIASDAPLHTQHGLIDLAHRRMLRDNGTDYE